MPQDSDIPMPEQPKSRRAQLQALAERVGVLAPGAPLTDELVAFADAAAALDRETPRAASDRKEGQEHQPR
jgi:hypothetical protein